MFWPRLGRVDFAAYHPWKPTLPGHRYRLDLADQSNPQAVDFIWSENARGHISGDTPTLMFHHVLTKLVFRLKDISGGSLEGVGGTIGRVPSKGVFDLAEGRLVAENDAAAVRDIALRRATDGDDDRATARLEAIVLPGETAPRTVEFTFSDGSRGRLTLDEKQLSGGKIYFHDVTVTGGGQVSTGAAVIVDWDDQNREPEHHFVIKTGNGGGDGGGDGDGDGDDPPERVRYFVERMGGSGTGADIGPDTGPEEPVGIAAYEGWSNRETTVTERFGFADIRRHGSLDAHIWFPPGVNCDLRIEGLPRGYSDVTLAYDITSADGSGVKASIVQVLVDGQNLTRQVTGLIASPGRYTRIVIPDLPASFTYLRFTTDATTNPHGIRIDNIVLEGTPKN
jgi:hypothetical protein